MNCAIHTNVEATGFCRNCGRALCAACTREVQGVLYCENCLAEIVSHQQTAPAPAAAAQVQPGPNPSLALFLGFIPDLGAVYNGEFMKAVIHVLIFAGLITLDSTGRGQPFFGIMTGAFCVYMVIDAFHTARMKSLNPAAPASAWAWSSDRPIGPIVLIVIGALFLLDRFFDIFDRMGEWWPVLLIAIGVALLWKRFGRRS